MKLRNKVLLWHAVFWLLVAATAYVANVFADDDFYVTASVGRAEFPFKAFRQDKSLSTVSNISTSYAFGVGLNTTRYTAVEATYYEFGQVTCFGNFAQEQDTQLNYQAQDTISGRGSAKGIAVAGLLKYPFRDKEVFLRGGVIRAKSDWTIEDHYSHAGADTAEPVTMWGDSSRGNFVIYGYGIGNKYVRAEYVSTPIQPHGDSAYGKIRAVYLTVKF